MPSAEPVFKAMADGTRRRLLQVLTRQELSVSELVEVLEQPQSTISRHLKVLRDAGLLIDRRSGPTVLYAARPPSGSPGNGRQNRPGADTSGSPGPAGRADPRDWVLDWVGREPVDAAAKNRLQRVIRQRRTQGAGFFETMGARWDQLRIEAFGRGFHLEALTALLPAAWTVGDIGTGTGYLLAVLSSRFRRVIAVEPAGAMLEVARNRPELRTTRNVEFREGSLAELPIETGELDLAIASLVLHHVEQPAAALGELRRCVREDGRVLIIEQRAHKDAAFRERMGDHWWGFSPAMLTRWVRQAGFSEVEVRGLSADHVRGRAAGDAPALFSLTARAGTAIS